MIERILLDMDGVTVDFFNAALRAHCAPECLKVTWPRGEYAIEKVLEISTEDFWTPLANYRFWRELDEYPGMPEFLVELLNLAPVTFASKVCESGARDCAAGKTEWLRARFGAKTPLVLLQGLADKSVLARPSQLLIDDHEGNVDKYREAGGPAILVPRPWNRGPGPAKFNEVDYDWILKEVKKYVNGDE